MNTVERDRVMGLLIGMGIVAIVLMMASGHHAHAPWAGRGPMMGPHWHAGGPPPFIIAAIVGGLVLLATGFAPLLLVGAGAFALFRRFGGHKGGYLPLGGRHHFGPGRTPPPAEEGIFCPSCEQQVSRDWATCPHCGYRKYLAPDLINRRCSTCGTQLQKDWHACPYCSTRVDEPITVHPPSAAQARPSGGGTIPDYDSGIV